MVIQDEDMRKISQAREQWVNDNKKTGRTHDRVYRHEYSGVKLRTQVRKCEASQTADSKKTYISSTMCAAM